MIGRPQKSTQIINMEIARSLYDKAPRWVKVIRWREWGQRIYVRQKEYCFILYLPLFLYCTDIIDNPVALQLYLRRPQTEEEVMKIKQNYSKNRYYHRNWELDQYVYQVPPMYDLSVRRKEYPQYYEGRYDVFKKDSL